MEAYTKVATYIEIVNNEQQESMILFASILKSRNSGDSVKQIKAVPGKRG